MVISSFGHVKHKAKDIPTDWMRKQLATAVG
jgi:hypothetical protein